MKITDVQMVSDSCQKIIQGIGSAKHSGRTDGPRSVANLRLGPVFIGKTTEP